MIAGPVCRLFRTPGFARVSMDDFVHELRMSKKTIYRHFPDKRMSVAAAEDAAVRCASPEVPGSGQEQEVDP